MEIITEVSLNCLGHPGLALQQMCIGFPSQDYEFAAEFDSLL